MLELMLAKQSEGGNIKSWCDKSDDGKIVILQRTLKTFRFLWSEGRPVFDTGIQGALFQANEPGYGRFIEQGGGAGQAFNSRGGRRVSG